MTAKKMQLTIAAITMFFALFAGPVSLQMPIPTRPNGYGVGGPPDAQVVIEMFLDLVCPDSKDAWPVVLQVMQTYGTRIHFRIHIFPLPYHTNAFVVAQGLQVIANFTNRNTDAIFRYTTLVLGNQRIWSNGPTQNMTMLQVMDSLASFVAEGGFMAKNDFLNGLKNSFINQETRVAWKYASSRGIFGTPMFLINGVITRANELWTLSDWQSVIDPLLASDKSFSLKTKYVSV